MLRSFFAVIAFLLMASTNAAELTMEDLRPRAWQEQEPMTIEMRQRMLAQIEKYAATYLNDVLAVTPQRFSHLQDSPVIVASLMTEAEDVKSMMKEFAMQLKALQKEPNDLRGWTLLVRHFYVIEAYADDLDTRRITTSKDYVGIRMHMPIVMDRIVIPSLTR